MDSIKRGSQHQVTQAALRQVNSHHLCLTVSSKCPKTQFLSANPGQYCFLTKSKGDTEAGVGRLLGEHQVAGLPWQWWTPPPGSPRAQWEQPYVCLAPPNSMRSSSGCSRTMRSRFTASDPTGARAAGDSPKLSRRLHRQQQKIRARLAGRPQRLRLLQGRERTSSALADVCRMLYA